MATDLVSIPIPPTMGSIEGALVSDPTRSQQLASLKVPRDALTLLADSLTKEDYWTPVNKLRTVLKVAFVTSGTMIMLTPILLHVAKGQKTAVSIPWNKTFSETAKSIVLNGAIQITNHPFRSGLICIGVGMIGHTKTVASKMYQTAVGVKQFAQRHPYVFSGIVGSVIAVGSGAGIYCYRNPEVVQKIIAKFTNVFNLTEKEVIEKVQEKVQEKLKSPSMSEKMLLKAYRVGDKVLNKICRSLLPEVEPHLSEADKTTKTLMIHLFYRAIKIGSAFELY